MTPMLWGFEEREVLMEFCERVSGAREISRVTHRITIRSAAMGSDRRPIADQRFRKGGRIFAIRGVTEADDRGAYLTCWVEEGPFA